MLERIVARHRLAWRGGSWRLRGARAVRGVLLAIALCLGWPDGAAAQSGAMAARDMLSSTAQLVVKRENGGQRAGSSIVVTSDGETGHTVLITAAHVLTPDAPQEIHATTPLRQEAVPARLLALDAEVDLAILEADSLWAKPITFAAEAALGDPVWVASFPWGGRATVVSGMVSQVDWEPHGTDDELPLSGPVALIDATVSHGMSGGGVFNRESGALIGIVRSHRSVHVRLPGESERTLTLPVAGETNVVSTQQILCFLKKAGYEQLVPDSLRGELTEGLCGAGS